MKMVPATPLQTPEPRINDNSFNSFKRSIVQELGVDDKKAGTYYGAASAAASKKAKTTPEEYELLSLKDRGTSWVWNYFLKFRHKETPKCVLSVCTKCVVIYSNEDTSGMGRHLESKHKIFENKDLPIQGNKKQKTIDSFSTSTFDHKIFQQKLLEVLISKDLSFSLVDDDKLESCQQPVLVLA